MGLAWLAPANLSHNKIVAAPNNRNEIQSSKGVFGRVRYALWGTPGYPPGHDLPTGIVYPWYRTIPIVTFVV